MKRWSGCGFARLTDKTGRRGIRHRLEYEMRRPPNSSVMYRGTQDWKPTVHETSAARGIELNPKESATMISMLLIDKDGFRWPVRFKLEPGMTLADVFNKTDSDWFGVHPLPTHRKYGYQVAYFGSTNWWCPVAGVKGGPHLYRCTKCAVLIPYEYLDAMAPPNYLETRWLKFLDQNGSFDVTANMRVACQIQIEEWMDGMTVALPQQSSFAFQMYYQQGVDKDTADGGVGQGFTGVRNTGDGYLFPTNKEKAQRPRYPQQGAILGQEMMEAGNDYGGENTISQLYTNKSGSTPLSKIFWIDNIDDMIRTRYPNFKGRYEFLNK